MPSSLSVDAICSKVAPRRHASCGRRSTSSGVIDGRRPRTTPSSRFASRPSRVRCPMSSRSSSATAAMICAVNFPVGVEVSRPRSRHTSAHRTLRKVEEVAEVADAAGEPVELRDDRPVRLAGLTPRRRERGRVGSACSCRQPLVGLDGEESPAAFIAGVPDGLPLCGETGAGAALLLGADPDVADDPEGLAGTLGVGHGCSPRGPGPGRWRAAGPLDLEGIIAQTFVYAIPGRSVASLDSDKGGRDSARTAGPWQRE